MAAFLKSQYRSVLCLSLSHLRHDVVEKEVFLEILFLTLSSGFQQACLPRAEGTSGIETSQLKEWKILKTRFRDKN